MDVTHRSGSGHELEAETNHAGDNRLPSVVFGVGVFGRDAGLQESAGHPFARLTEKISNALLEASA